MNVKDLTDEQLAKLMASVQIEQNNRNKMTKKNPTVVSFNDDESSDEEPIPIKRPQPPKGKKISSTSTSRMNNNNNDEFVEQKEPIPEFGVIHRDMDNNAAAKLARKKKHAILNDVGEFAK